MNEQEIIAGRTRLLATAVARLQAREDVVGIFLSGSLAAGMADAWSDIDLRVVVEPACHAGIVAERCAIPAGWPDFLFNEWRPGTQHCVSHFRPFNKIDIFYWSADALDPSPWHALPTRILYDPNGLAADFLAASRRMSFAVTSEEVDRSIGKGLAAAHEAYRRIARGELLYANTLLDELRHNIMLADDWIHRRTPDSTAGAKYHRRATSDVLDVLYGSLCRCTVDELHESLTRLVQIYRRQITDIHETYALARPLANDLEALAAIDRGRDRLR